jgi:hypothetical protein
LISIEQVRGSSSNDSYTATLHRREPVWQLRSGYNEFEGMAERHHPAMALLVHI